ncbi:hypothetical protein J2T57_000536 [Natronocella acetinitrilica]|uniref:DUF2782 domain-containing protein n=1 Tax=Natronocella acetinitrilica TaxID=414046 RepID=A0AAE3KAE9_9GAMM|nr:DUF2782 domain-containing protein [Natronocella acetinitrilica]MCP1673444.1 hypothetical protein [Natronocella acetinitrilica]
MARFAVVLALLGLLCFLPIHADELRRPIITAPPPPEELMIDEELEPRVTIIEREWATIEEYSVNGQVYAVKITPALGPPYYFYDLDGRGSWQRFEDPGAIPSVRQWKIIRW